MAKKKKQIGLTTIQESLKVVKQTIVPAANTPSIALIQKARNVGMSPKEILKAGSNLQQAIKDFWKRKCSGN